MLGARLPLPAAQQDRAVALRRLLRGALFERIISDDEAFGELRVDDESGTICWPTGADLDPDVLHGDFAPSWTGEPISA
ncbi:MAG: DUF2442 domain-containing protein [Mycobacteriales bacterium]